MSRNYRMYGVLDDRETEVEVLVKVHSWGHPEMPPAYAHGGLPADPPEVEVIDAWLVDDGKDAPSILPSLTDAELERFAVEFLESDHG